jgi:cell division protein FtsN
MYRVQVGAFRAARNAKEAFDRLASAGFSPAFESYGDLYRVVISGIRAQDVPAIAQRLGNAGFAEVWIREEL